MDNAILRNAEFLQGLDDGEAARILAIARPFRFQKGECLFLLGDHADRVYVVLGGRVELSFPLSFGGTLRDVSVEVKGPGGALGWSALVQPHRFTLTGRAIEPCDLVAFQRQDLFRVFDENPRIGFQIMRKVAEIVGRRLLQMQALWAREIQRAVSEGLRAPEPPAH